MRRRRLLQLAAAAPVAAVVPAIAAVPSVLSLPARRVPNMVVYKPVTSDIADGLRELIAYGKSVFGPGWGEEFIRRNTGTLIEGVRSAEALKRANQAIQINKIRGLGYDPGARDCDDDRRDQADGSGTAVNRSNPVA